MKKIAVIGAGSWGTALAVTLSDKGHQVKIWDLNAEHLMECANNRENVRFLPGVKWGDNLVTAPTPEETIQEADIVLFSAPAQHFRAALKSAMPYLTDDMVLVNVAKGIEQGSLLRMSQIADEIYPTAKYVVLSGPSHAEEVGIKLPTTVSVASRDMALAEYIQDVFITEHFRVYTNHDVPGVELGGALKNIIALGAGISDGMGFGDNAKAALMTRGMVEMARLGVALGGEAATFWGLTGMGDLIVTCTSMHSRNRRCGILIGQGMDPQEAVAQVGMVVEGMYTAEAAYGLAQKVGIEMPFTERITKVIRGEMDARTAATELMLRERKHE